MKLNLYITTILIIFQITQTFGQDFAPIGAEWYYSSSAGGAAPTASEYYYLFVEPVPLSPAMFGAWTGQYWKYLDSINIE